MRIGAIFARGSCRALKWMALFGVVFALGAGSAFAQITPDNTFDMNGVKVEGLGKTIMEGEGATVKVSVRANIPANTSAETTVTIAVTVVAAAEETPTNDPSDNYEETDIVLNNATGIEVVFPANAETDAATKTETKSVNVFLQTSHDVDAEREDFALDIDVTGITLTEGEANVESTIIDDEPQTYVLKITTEEPSEGTTTIDGTVTADPAHENMAANLRLHLDNADYSLDDTTATGFAIGNAAAITGAMASHSFMITPPTNDKNRVEDTLTVSLYSGTAGDSTLEDSEEVAVADANALPAVTAEVILLDEDGDPLDDQPEDGVEYISEGQMVDLKITVVNKDGEAMDAAEDLMVSLMPTGDASEQDYRLSMHPVAIASGDDSATVQLTASEDQDIGMEMLMLDASVSGDMSMGDETRMSMGVLSVGIMDTTMKQVEAKTEAELMPIIYGAIDEGEGDDGVFSPYEMIEIDASMLFMPTDYMLTYSAESDMMDVASVETSGSMVTVTGKMAGGPAHITITATATGMMSGAKPLEQTSPNVAQVIFPVTVELAELMVELSMDDAMMNITEGMGAMVTATANRPVTMDTMVELIQTEGTASPSDYMAEPLMIMAGETMGTTMVMAVADDMMEEGETLTLEGRVGEMKTNTVMFYIWDAAVPALPLIAQLLLAAFLAIGGYRRYLRR